MNGQNPNVNNNVVGAPTSLGAVPNGATPPVEGSATPVMPAAAPVAIPGNEVVAQTAVSQPSPVATPTIGTDATPVAPVVPNQAPVEATPVVPGMPSAPTTSEVATMPAAPAEPVSAPVSTTSPVTPATAAPDPMAQAQVTPTPVASTPSPAPVSTPASNAADLTAVPQPIPGTSPAAATGNVNPMGKTNSNGFVEPAKVANIGAVPPPKKKEEKKGPNKMLFIVLIVVLLAAIGFGVYYFLFLGKSSIEVVTKDLTSNINVPLSNDPNDYATITGTDSKNCTVSTLNVNITVAGNYQYTISCGGETFKGNITIVDEQAPEVVLQDVIVKAGTTVAELDFIESCSKDTCTYKFANAATVTTNLQTPGEYKVDINVSDDNENTATVTGTLVVLSSDSNWILECLLEEEMSSGSATKTINDQYSINTQNNYSGFARRIVTYEFDNKDAYTQAVGNKEATITFDGITGNASYDDENNTLVISKILSTDELTTTFGGTLQTTYVGIRTHYTTLGYSFDLIDLSEKAQ